MKKYKDMPASFFIAIGIAVIGMSFGLGWGLNGIAGCEARRSEALRKSEIRANELKLEQFKLLIQAKRDGIDIKEFGLTE